MIRCPDCSHDIRPEALFCEKCGLSLDKFNASTLQPDPTTSSTRDFAAGLIIDKKYRLVEKLGEGNIGAVYRVRRTDIRLEAAIKLLDPKYLTDRKAVERFKREAEAVSRIRHQNVVSIYDFGEAAGNAPAFIVMELVEGDSLRTVLDNEGRLEPGRAISLMREICQGVAAGHRLGIIHRDLKPANIMVLKPDDDDDLERVKVLDFGLAKLRDVDNGSDLTEAGTVMGTPFYMSPEQCLGESLDPRSDVYSLGTMFYEMVAGKRPFQASDFSALSRQHINKPPPPLSDDLRLPAPLVSTIMRALSKEPAQRQEHAASLANELKAIAKARSFGLQAEAPTLEMGKSIGSRGEVDGEIRKEILKSFVVLDPCNEDWPSWKRWNKLMASAEVDDEHRTFEYLNTKIVERIRSNPQNLPSSGSETASVLLFGLPGTGKRTLVHALADGLGWPIIMLSPGEFIQQGLEFIEAQARSVFERLQQLRQVVVLFDECDELFQDRQPSYEFEQMRNTTAFVTATMISKLQDLHDRGRVVFCICTNKFYKLDRAIKGGGVIDHIIAVGPPQKRSRRRIVEQQLRSISDTPGKTQAIEELVNLTDGFVRREILRACEAVLSLGIDRMDTPAATTAVSNVANRIRRSLTITEQEYEAFKEAQRIFSHPVL